MKYVRVEELRKKGKYTQADLAAVLGVNYRTYAHYEKGDRDMSPEVLIKLADFYQVSIDYLLGRTDNPALAK